MHQTNLSSIGHNTSVVANELHIDPDKLKTFLRAGNSNFNK